MSRNTPGSKGIPAFGMAGTAVRAATSSTRAAPGWRPRSEAELCLDADGRPLFYSLLYRRAAPIYAAFDVLFVGERDLRRLPLVERKQRLRALVRPKPQRLLYVDHVEERGVELYKLACARDLEGIVAKHGHAPYISGREGSTAP